MTGESRWEMSQSGETSGALSPGDVLSLCFAVPLASSRTCRGLTKAVLCRSQPGQGRWQAFAAKCVDLTEATLRCCSQAKQLTPPLSSLPWITVDGTPVGPALGSEELLGHAVCQRIKARGLPEPRGCAFQPRRPRPLYAGGSYTDEGWRGGGGGGGGVDVTSIVEVVLFCLIGASIAHLWCEAPPAERHVGTIHTDDGGDFEGGGYHDGGGNQDFPDRR